jgi:hypothetical protein
MTNTGGVDGREIAVPLDLEHAGPYIKGVAMTVGEELGRLRAKLEPLLSSGWVGAAEPK